MEMKTYHNMRSIDQGMGSELAAADPKWGVATRRVVGDRHHIVAAHSEATDHWPLAHHAVRGWY